MMTNTGLWLFLRVTAGLWLFPRVTAVSAAPVRTSGRRDPGHRHGLLHWSTHRLYRGAGMSTKCPVSIWFFSPPNIYMHKIHEVLGRRGIFSVLGSKWSCFLPPLKVVPALLNKHVLYPSNLMLLMLIIKSNQDFII